MTDNNSNSVIVLDNGSGYLKAGFSSQTSPEIVIPALIGREILRYGEKIDLEQIKATKKKKILKSLITKEKEKKSKKIMILIIIIIIPWKK